jgi:hypothetical protein
MVEGDTLVKEDGRVIILQVLGDCNGTFIEAEVVVEEYDLQQGIRRDLR